MKTLSSELSAHIAQPETTLVVCWKLARTDGQVFGFTEHDQDLVISGTTYSASSGFTPTAIQTTSDLSVDNLDLEGLLDSSTITEEDLLAGLYDYAEVEIFMVNWEDLGAGVIKLRKGRLGEVQIKNGNFVAEMRGMMQALQQVVGENYSITCRAELGDLDNPVTNRCKVRLEPPQWQASTAYTERTAGDANAGSVVRPTAFNGRHFKCTVAGTSGASEPTWDTTVGNTTTDGTVTWTAIEANTYEGDVDGITDNANFTSIDLTPATGFFKGGRITFTSGLNNGLTMEVKEFTQAGGSVGGEIELQQPMPFDIALNDTFKMTAGCRKRFTEDCKNKFDNIHNFRGEPHVPGIDQLHKHTTQ